MRAALIASLLVLHSHALTTRSHIDRVGGASGRYIDVDNAADSDEVAGFMDVDEKDEATDELHTSNKATDEYPIAADAAAKLTVISDVETDIDTEDNGENADYLTEFEDNGTIAKINFSPERRKELHDYKYEADFWVELNMTRGHEGVPMGLVVYADENWIPMSISKIHKWGLVEDWNNANPGYDLHVGDQIIQVNNVVWHANSRKFQYRMVDQFKAGRRALPGTSEVFKMHILRPRKNPADHRTAYQRMDAHHKLYPQEFVAELPVHRIKPGSSMEHVLGMTLNYWAGHNYVEPWVEDIKSEGIIATWNEAHPDRQIMEGDEIIRVNHRNFQHNRSQFQKIFQEQYDKAHRLQLPFDVYVRRPRYVQEMYDRLPVRETVDDFDTFVDARLPLSAHGDNRLSLGWQVEEVDADDSPITITKILGQGSLADWNADNPSKMIMPGDVIVKANGVPWRNDSMKFVDKLSKQLQASRGGELRLLVKRHNRTVRSLNRIVPGTRNKVSLVANVEALSLAANVSSDNSLGMNISYDDKLSPCYVAGIAEHGLVAQWNAVHPAEMQIEVNDFIVSVNGVPWRQDAEQYSEFIQQQYRSSQNDALQESRLDIVLQKPFGDVKHGDRSWQSNVARNMEAADHSDFNATDKVARNMEAANHSDFNATDKVAGSSSDPYMAKAKAAHEEELADLQRQATASKLLGQRLRDMGAQITKQQKLRDDQSRKLDGINKRMAKLQGQADKAKQELAALDATMAELMAQALTLDATMAEQKELEVARNMEAANHSDFNATDKAGDKDDDEGGWVGAEDDP